MLKIDQADFKDGYGRSVMLRGVNLGGSSKLPVHPNGATHLSEKFYEHRAVSFVGRPFPPADADQHFSRLRHWGFNTLRFLITWEALEHAGPGLYDLVYLDYLQKMVEKAGEYGFYVFIDPHQDVWSRWTGGDGAPGWTLEAVGFDLTNLDETGAALSHQVHGDPYPRMIWPTNYSKLAAATMFTLFFGGDTFAPATQIEGESAQSYLQRHYFNAIKTVAERLVDMPHVIGYDTLNEPSSGLIGVENLNDKRWGVINIGTSPTPYEAMRLAAGDSLEVDHWTVGTLGPKVSGRNRLNRNRVSAWRPDATPVWQANQVWEKNEHGAILTRPNHFSIVDGRRVDFVNDYYRPFIEKFIEEIRSVDPDTLIFVEPALTHKLPEIDRPGLVNGGHWYDGYLLFTKTYNPRLAISLENTQPIIGRGAIDAAFKQEMADIAAEGRDNLNGPTLIGEFGIPYDLNEKVGYTAENFSPHRAALDRTFRALEANLLSCTLWNYTADNNNAHGDLWNNEDLSIFSRDQIGEMDDPHDLDAGGRAVGAFCRPYPFATAGKPLALSFDLETRRFRYRVSVDPTIGRPTELYVPDFHYGVGLGIEVTDGRIEYDQSQQTVRWWHEHGGEQEITIFRDKGEAELLSGKIETADETVYRLEHHYITVSAEGEPEVKLHVVEAGPDDGELVILLHGFPEFWYGWREQIPFLVRLGYRVVVPDQRGYNLSDKPKRVSDYRLDALADDVLGLIRAYGQESAIVIGHDWGAAVTWYLAGRNPDKVSRAIVLNVPHLEVMYQNLRTDRQQMAKSWYIGLFQIPGLVETVGRLTDYRPGEQLLTKYSALPDTFSAEDVERYRGAWGRPRALKSMVNWYRAMTRHGPESVALRLPMPVLIIWGAQDVALGRGMANESLNWCDDGRLVFIEEATHWVQHDEPERVNRLIERFLTFEQ